MLLEWNEETDDATTAEQHLLPSFCFLVFRYRPITLWFKQFIWKSTRKTPQALQVRQENPILVYEKDHGQSFLSKIYTFISEVLGFRVLIS